MNFKFCLPDVSGRGAGLGNEMVPWARAFLASQVLDARCLLPAFGLNERKYWRHFGTPRWDWLQHRVLKASLPSFCFDESDYLDHGGGDVVQALQRFAVANDLMNRQAFVFRTQGMWGGMHHIAAARDYIRSQLYLSRFAAGNLLRLRSRLDPSKLTVGVHVRLGDFAAALQPQEYRGRFNVSLPMPWYRSVLLSLHEQMGEGVQFLIVSDASTDRLLELGKGLPCIYTGDIPDSDCSDLLALAAADLLVCSVSSFSVWAAFLSSAPYIWYEPSLHQHGDRFLSIWGHEPGQQSADSPTRKAIAQVEESKASGVDRAFAVGSDGAVPKAAVAKAYQHRPADTSRDLVNYGVIPTGNGQEDWAHSRTFGG